MSTTENGGPQFRGAIIGYNKAEVDDYVARAEFELKINESRQGKFEKQISELNAEINRLNNILDAERAEKKPLSDKVAHLNRMIEDMDSQLQRANSEKAKVQQEFRELQEKVDSEGINPKIIQDAILNAQRMGEIVISEANEKAEEIMHQAEADRRAQEEAGRKAIEEAKEEASRVIGEAERKCSNLQQDYDRILMDVTGFKAEMLKMYRRHMELLATLPEKEIPELEGDFREAQSTGAEFTETEEEN